MCGNLELDLANDAPTKIIHSVLQNPWKGFAPFTGRITIEEQEDGFIVQTAFDFVDDKLEWMAVGTKTA